MPYFHLVFTQPHALNGLVQRHPRRLYELLFRAVSDTLLEFAANPRHLGGTPAFTLVLHTWTQQLELHPHLHALMAGGALTKDGAWVSPRRGFLFPAKALSAVFRGKFVAALQQERDGHLAGDPALDAAGWPALLATLYRHDWVVYAKQPMGGPAQVLDYLARYTHKVAISNHRLLGLDQGQVSFRVRDAQRPKSGRVVALPATEFIGRFLSHVLPPGFKRIRHYGLLANCHKVARLATCRALFGLPAPAPAVIESVDAFMARVAQVDLSRCPHCADGRMRVIAALTPLRRTFTPRSSTGPPP